MKEPRASHFWSQELKDQIINSGWLSVCWSSLPEGLNILPDRLWWLLSTLFIPLQFGTIKLLPGAPWELLQGRFSQHNCSWAGGTAQRGWAVLAPCLNPHYSLPFLWGLLLLSGLQGVSVHAVKVKIKLIVISVFCMPCCVWWGLGPSPPLFNTYRWFWVRAAGPTRAIHSSSGLWAWCPVGQISGVVWVPVCSLPG